MKKFILILCCERTIENPKFFETLEQAQENMRSQFEYIMLGLDDDFNAANYENCEPYKHNISGMSAFISDDDNNYDWRIFEIKEGLQ